MPRVSWPVLLLGTLALVTPASAQRSWTSAFSLSARGDVAFPSGDITDAVGHHAGYGFGAVLKYWPTSHAAIYLGWDHFDFRQSTDTLGAKLVDAGFRAGLEGDLRPGGESVDPFVFGGVIWNRAKLSLDDGDTARKVSADREAGFEAGAGIRLRIWRGVWLIPEGRYRWHPADLSPLLGTGRSDVAYTSLNLGLWFHL